MHEGYSFPFREKTISCSFTALIAFIKTLITCSSPGGIITGALLFPEDSGSSAQRRDALH